MSLDMHMASLRVAAQRNNNRFEKSLENDKRMEFRLKEQEEEFVYQPESRQFSFYQICMYSVDKKYHVRKIIYDEYGDMVKSKEDKLKKSKLDKFLKKCPEYKYTIYPAYNLDIVGLPQPNEILTAKSQILNCY